MESDSRIAINVIIKWNKIPKLIRNLVEDIRILATYIRDIQFVYHNRKTNSLADNLAKSGHLA